MGPPDGHIRVAKQLAGLAAVRRDGRERVSYFGVVPGARAFRAKQEATMDKDRIKGAATDMKGKAKEALGKVTGDTKTEAEGKADQLKGKVQNAVGGAKDALKE